MKDNLTLLLIEHKHGTNTHVCDRPATAINILYQWVQEYWEPDHYGTIPAGRHEVINAYFDFDASQESYQLDCQPHIYTINDQLYNKEIKE